MNRQEIAFMQARQYVQEGDVTVYRNSAPLGPASKTGGECCVCAHGADYALKATRGPVIEVCKRCLPAVMK